MQFVKCQYPIDSAGNDDNTIIVDNGLFHSSLYVVRGGEDLVVRGQHWTVNQCDKVGYTGYGYGTGDLYLTNCMVVAATNGWGELDSVTTNSTAFFTTDPGGIFQTVGAGSHYLANTNYRNAGTTNISADLLASLQKKTTYPPVVLSNLTIAASTNLLPLVARDTGIPDLGFHYEVLDFIVDTCAITNATLTLTNGVAIAHYNKAAGIWLREGSAIVSFGTPFAPNWVVHYSLVQEQPVFIGDTDPAYSLGISSYHESTPAPNAQYRFTQFVAPAGGSSLVHDTSWAYANLFVQDCEFWNGWNYFGGNTGSVATVQNNLFHRAPVWALSSGTSTLTFFNNLIWGTAAGFLNSASTNLWRFEDNAFDNCNLTAYSAPLTNKNNAYINCDGRLQPTNVTDIVLSSFSYASGPLGDFYQGQNDLIGQGSWTAASRGLFHHTTQTNQTREGSSWLDIGFHYVALTNRLPVDTDGDGLPDYLEDTVGDGRYWYGDFSSWTNADSDGDCVSDGVEYQQGSNLTDIPEFASPPVYQILPIGATAVFSATMTQGCLSGYQWDVDGTNIVSATNLTLTLTNVQLSSNGFGLYRLRAFSPTKTNSAAARLVVLDDPGWTIWTNYITQTNNKSIHLWTNAFGTTNLIWNTNCLLYGKTGYTAISWSNSFQGTQARVTALTRRHGYTAGHMLTTEATNRFAGHEGAKVWFCASDNRVVEMTVAAAYLRTIGGYDYALFIFSQDLTNTITPMAVMDAPSSIGVNFRTCQHQKMSANMPPFISGYDTSKPPFNEELLQLGDSGSPNMIPTRDGSLVFIGGTSSIGTPSRKMQEDMDYLCTNNTYNLNLNITNYQLNWFNDYP